MFLNYYHRGSQCKWNNGDAERNDYVITRNISYFKKYYQNEKNRNIMETTKKNEEGEEDTGDELLGSNKQPVPPEPRRYPVRNRKKPKCY